jgi:hypothetical protein
MKRLIPIPSGFIDQLKRTSETGIGYQIVSVELKDGRFFDQVLASEGCIIEVRGYKEIPFAPDEVASVIVTHQRWNFRDGSDARTKNRGATA